MLLHQLWNRVVFAYDCNRIESVAGVRYLWDYSPNGFHFQFPGGAADPTPQLDGSLSFDGGDYLALPAGSLARFYAKMPTAEHTWLAVFTSSDTTGIARRLFSCDNAAAGGTWKGIELAHSVLFSRAFVFAYHDLATQDTERSANDTLHASGKNALAATVETTPRGMHNQGNVAYTWVVGAHGTSVYDATVVPHIGVDTPLARQWIGRMSYLALVNGVVSTSDLLDLNRMTLDGGKPWCNRV